MFLMTGANLFLTPRGASVLDELVQTGFSLRSTGLGLRVIIRCPCNAAETEDLMQSVVLKFFGRGTFRPYERQY